MIRLLFVALLAASIIGCNELDSITPSVPEADAERAPIYSGYDQGLEAGSKFLADFEHNYQRPFGGDGSILLFLRTFEIPLVWNEHQAKLAGTPVTDWHYQHCRAGFIVMGSLPAADLLTDYQRGALDAL